MKKMHKTNKYGYYQSDTLQKLIDWDNIMEMSRNAGGHDEQMQGLFMDSKVVGHWNEGGYQGSVATCALLEDGRFVIYNDYYGSCSGCDSWENASDEAVRNMCIGLANSAYVFDDIKDVKNYLNEVVSGNIKGNYSWDNGAANGLLHEINEHATRNILNEIGHKQIKNKR